MSTAEQPKEGHMATNTPTAGRVRSGDGTTIAFERSGAGSPVIVVGGAFNDRTTAAPLAAALAATLTAQREDRSLLGPGASARSERSEPRSREPRPAQSQAGLTVYAYDRRGRGDSGDTAPYAVDREVEDLQALIAEAGGAAGLYGVSSGAILAIEAAAAGIGVSQLALFEPPFTVDDSRPHHDSAISTELAELTSAGRRREAVELFMRKAVGLPDELVAQVRESPMWPELEKLAHTLPYDTTITGDGTVPARLLASITVPTIVIGSEGSPPWLRSAVRAVAEALPHARRRSLAGEYHEVPPDVLGPVLTEFFTGRD
jgi:pimeloyl-ACP methyl ester carboxylesterase